MPELRRRAAPDGGEFEESELIDVIEARYEAVQVKQQKYVCRCGGCVETAIGLAHRLAPRRSRSRAARPERASPGSHYLLAFAIKVVLDKWLYHLPLERQVRMLGDRGLVVTSQALWDLANTVAHRLSRVSGALLDHVLAQPVIGLDQTSWPRIEGQDQKPWQMWCLTAPGAVVHRIRDDKSAATFVDLVGTYTGTIVCDALATHTAGARAGPGITLPPAGTCLSPFRRSQARSSRGREGARVDRRALRARPPSRGRRHAPRRATPKRGRRGAGRAQGVAYPLHEPRPSA